MKIRPVIILVCLFLLASIFLFINSVKGNYESIVISEICPTGCASSGHQWLEIYNKGSEAVDLSGWIFWEGGTNHSLNLVLGATTTLSAGGYAIITQNDEYFLTDWPNVSSTGALVFDSSWGTLNKSGEEIGLKDADKNFIKTSMPFVYSAVVSSSLERVDFDLDPVSSTAWQENIFGQTPGEINYCLSNNCLVEEDGEEEEDDEEETGEEEEDDEEEDEYTPTTTLKSLVINEFLSNSATGTEWVEIYNLSTSSVDFSGWTVEEGAGSTLSTSTIIEPNDFLVLEFSSSKLNNDGDTIILKNLAGEIIDQVIYGSGGITAPAKGNTMARNVDGSGDFVETTTLTPGQLNIIIAPVSETPPPSSGGGGGSVTPPVSYTAGIIVINELVSDPSDGNEEFVELYNKTSANIDLSGWWIEEGSESKTSLSGNISAKGFYVIEKPKGNLNNAGDMVVLFSPDGKEIDRVTYGTWDDGNVNDNAVAPKDPLSLARKVDGQDSNNDYYDFVLTSTITPEKSNIISAFTKEGKIIEQLVNTSQIVINEVLPNPEGPDKDEEFIELKNLGTETVNLRDWQLSDSTSRKYKITQGIIKSKSLFLFKRSMTGIALNNTGGDEVKLYGSNGSLVDSVKYTDSAGEAESYARKADGSWAWTTKPTPEVDNIITGRSVAPIVVIDTDTEVSQGELVVFDASDTTDPDNEDMFFVWNFGDDNEITGEVVEYSFAEEGVYTITLTVTDSSANESIKQVIITVKNRLDFAGGYLAEADVNKIEISEFVPNPEGSDTTEFIELVNRTTEVIDISGLKLDDEEGGSRAYTIPNNTLIEPGQYLVFGKQDTGLALNNTSDAVRLLYPEGTILKEVYYDDVPEGAAYIQDENDNWVWTSTLTPGEANVMTPIVEKVSARTVSRSKYIKPTIYTTLEHLRDEGIGDQVAVTGVVAVEPGVLATQYFYIVGSPGVQVYMYKKDWPILRVGDRVEISGEISEAYGNIRVKLSEKNDIKIIDHPGAPESHLVDIAEIGEPLEGWLVRVNGEITEIKSSYMYVDDGTEEVRVYFKQGTGIDKKIYKVGDIVSVTGIVAQTKSEYQILPRGQEDLEKTGRAEEFVILKENKKEEDKKEVAEKYLTATAGGLTSILFGLFAKARGKMVLALFKKLGILALAIFKRRV